MYLSLPYFALNIPESLLEAKYLSVSPCMSFHNVEFALQLTMSRTTLRLTKRSENN